MLVVYIGIVAITVVLVTNEGYQAAHPLFSLAVLAAFGALWPAHKVDRLHPVQQVSEQLWSRSKQALVYHTYSPRNVMFGFVDDFVENYPSHARSYTLLRFYCKTIDKLII
jgi:hypothetical protein